MPAALHVAAAVGALAAEPQSVLGFQWYALVFTAVIWSAGRLGQRVGRAFAGSPRRPGTTRSGCPERQDGLRREAAGAKR